MNPRVAIVVLNYNGLEDTRDCLESLHKIDYPDYKVYVVDNGSRDSQAQKIREEYPWACVAGLPENLGFTGGNNFILDLIPYTGYDYVLLLNNDTVVGREFLSYMVKAGESDPRIGIVGAMIFYYGEEDDSWFSYCNAALLGGLGPLKVWYNGGVVNPWTSSTHHLSQWHFPESMFDTDYVTGCCMLIKRKLIEEQGGFYPGYFAYLEDLEYCTRARENGWRIVVEQLAYLYHKVSKTSKKSSDLAFYLYLRNRLLYITRNHDAARQVFSIPWVLATYFAPQLLYNILFLEGKRVRLAFQALAEGLSGRTIS